MFLNINPAIRKIFVGGFFRTHGGMLVFIFVVFVSYCLLINTLGVVPADQIDFWQFFFSISLVSNPIIMAIYLFGSCLYIYKSLNYLLGQLALPQHVFLKYSFTSLSKGQQFKSWFAVQAYIFLPIFFYTLYAVTIGIVFKYYFFSLLILLFQLLLVVIGAYICLKESNNLILNDKANTTTRLTKKWDKPIFFLYNFQIFNNSKLAYVLTKLTSYALLCSIFMVFGDVKDNFKLLMLVTSCIVLAHVILTYQERIFNRRFLSFIGNFPFSKEKMFFGFCLNYLVLLLPEMCWLFTNFNTLTAINLILFIFSIILLFRSLLLLNTMQIKRFLVVVFCLFFAFYFFILFGFGLILIPINIAFAWALFKRNYLNEGLLV